MIDENIEDQVQQALGTKTTYITKVVYSYQDGTEHSTPVDTLYSKEVLATSPQEAADICFETYHVFKSRTKDVLYWVRVVDSSNTHCGDYTRHSKK